MAKKLKVYKMGFPLRSEIGLRLEKEAKNNGFKYEYYPNEPCGFISDEYSHHIGQMVVFNGIIEKNAPRNILEYIILDPTKGVSCVAITKLKKILDNFQTN